MNINDNGVPLHQIPKMVKVMRHRTGRYYYQPIEDAPPTHMSTFGNRAPDGSLQYPMVWVSVAAGVIGVILVVVIILSIWIRRRCCSNPTRPADQLKAEYVAACSTESVICSSVHSSTENLSMETTKALPVIQMISESKRDGGILQGVEAV